MVIFGWFIRFHDLPRDESDDHIEILFALWYSSGWYLEYETCSALPLALVRDKTSVSTKIGFRLLNSTHGHGTRVGPLSGEAAPPGAGHLSGDAAQLVGRAVEAGVAVGGVGGVEADGGSLVVVVLVHRPRAAARHYDGVSEVIDVELWRVLVKVLLVAHEVLSLVEVERVVLVSVGCAGVPQRGGRVVERLREIDAVVLVPGVVRGPIEICVVVVLEVVPQPDAVHAGRAEAVVVGAEGGGVVVVVLVVPAGVGVGVARQRRAVPGRVPKSRVDRGRSVIIRPLGRGHEGGGRQKE